MIYLIDDKNKRLEKNKNKIEKHKYRLKVIRTYEELELKKNDIFKKDNIILYHDSFLNNLIFKVDSNKKENFLKEIIQEKKFSKIAIFSGGIKLRKVNGDIAYLPDSFLYNNLDEFITNNSELKFLLYGKKPEIENKLLTQLKEVTIDIFRESAIDKSDHKSFFFTTRKNKIEKPLNKYESHSISKVEDIDFAEMISNHLNKEKYDNVFIPLCFGNTLSDYNGLRLASYIRCAKSKNQLSNIIIYGFVTMIDLLENKYFNILKTKNVKVVPYSKKSFAEEVDSIIEQLNEVELIDEMEKLELKPLKNGDSHSVANEWGIYQMARNGGISIDKIKGFNFNKFQELYFRWLITINELDEPIPKEQIEEQEKIFSNYKKLELPKVLFKIDLSKNKK